MGTGPRVSTTGRDSIFYYYQKRPRQFRDFISAEWNSAYRLISTEAARSQTAKERHMVALKEQVLGHLTTDSRNPASVCAAKLPYATSLDALLLECVDEALTDLLGTRAREAVYDHLERNLFLSRTEIPVRLDDFFTLLDETFGKGGKTIGRYIARKLYAKLDWEFVDVATFEFGDYLEMVKARIAREVKSVVTPL